MGEIVNARWEVEPGGKPGEGHVAGIGCSLGSLLLLEILPEHVNFDPYR